MSISPEPHRESRFGRGAAYGIAAYTLWGLAPIYWTVLKPASSLEIVAHRTIWSFIFIAPLVIWQGRWSTIKNDLKDRRKRYLLLIASILISGNWLVFIWATTNGHILDSSLGYFTIPIFSTALGVLFLNEQLRPLQWAAIAVAALAVGYITWEHHAFPWIGLSLAGSFALYGLVKKLAGVDALESLLIETAYLVPIALGYLVVIAIQGTISFGHHGIAHSIFLAGAGLATAIPLLLYGAAVIRIPLFFIGFMQYIASTIQFFVGIYVFHEEMDPKRFMGFAITWTALVLLGTDSIRQRRMPASQVVALD